MARKFVFPDVNDRSANSTSIIATSDQIIGLYNQANPNDKMERVTQKVQDWFTSQATTTYQWDNAEMAGNQCFLRANIPPR